MNHPNKRKLYERLAAHDTRDTRADARALQRAIRQAVKHTPPEPRP